jgi:hypothetical protein
MTLGETFRLCVKGIAHRLLRSVLTLAVVVLAVAFFMFLLSENMYIRATARGVWEEVGRERLSGRLLTHLYSPVTSLVLSRKLSHAREEGETRLGEYAAVSGWESGRVDRLAAGCAREQEYLQFFENIPVGKRLVLVHKQKGREIFRGLQDASERVSFEERIRPMLDLRLPGEVGGFRAFLAGYPEFERELTAFTEAWNTQVQSLQAGTQALTAGATVESWLASATAEQMGRWRDLVGRHGFRLDEGAPERVQDQLRLAQLRQAVVTLISTQEKDAQWRRVFRDRKKTSADDKIARLDEPGAGTVLGSLCSEAERTALAERERMEQTLSGLEKKLSGKVDPSQAGQTLSARQGFLLFISFVVCMVGIANAMLMSITERFREIATMKCLGATDRYILIQFMLEAGLQGIAGGTLGMLIGFVIATLKSGISFGSYVFTYWPGGGLLASAAGSLAAGVVLAILASIYPSWAASRMAPMEAMRVE